MARALNINGYTVLDNWIALRPKRTITITKEYIELMQLTETLMMTVVLGDPKPLCDKLFELATNKEKENMATIFDSHELEVYFDGTNIKFTG